jgi:hypothetical protein
MTKPRDGYQTLLLSFAPETQAIATADVATLASEFRLDEAALGKVFEQAQKLYSLALQHARDADPARREEFFAQLLILKRSWDRLSFGEKRSIFTYRVLDDREPEQKPFEVAVSYMLEVAASRIKALPRSQGLPETLTTGACARGACRS